MEAKRLTMKQIEGLSLAIKKKWITDKGIDVNRLRVALADEYGVKLGHNRSYQLKTMLAMHHPELLDENENYKIIGMPFYNEDTKSNFNNVFEEKLGLD